MVSLALHVAAFFILFPTGLNRLIAATLSFLYCHPSSSSSSSTSHPSFISKPWWFFLHDLPTAAQSRSNRHDNLNFLIKKLDFFALLVSLPLASLTHIFLFLSVPSSHSPAYRFSFLLFSSSIFLFWVLFLHVLVKYFFLHDNSGLVRDEYLFIFAGVCFSVEYWMIGRGMDGLAGEFYGILGWVSLVCCGCCLVLGVKPSAFFAEHGLCCGLMVKGTWGLQVGLNMGTDGGWFAWKGCERVGVVGVGELDVGLKCDVEQDGLRGLALMRLSFVWHVIGVLVGSLVLFWVLSMKGSSRLGDARGPLLLRHHGTDQSGVRPVAEFELA
ncbi:hypothetical protein MLD38_027275 [Melastoma candidum]|uniref:Uncharacterized protein n=1 Tax=Melastoma candidum TaxID=119954 RepID=A0ACB9P2A3_9MYRT|nr:hypothetical protein MLD38_027275 [Melastoma candidum]